MEERGVNSRNQDDSFGPLFSVPVARARNTDPVTSHIAAATVERTGVASTQRAQILHYVAHHPDLTASEIAEGLGIERIIPGKRLPELRDAGYLVNGAERTCRVRGTKCMTWRAA
jgi:DNA-binding transcriptional ArsR family regulator